MAERTRDRRGDPGQGPRDQWRDGHGRVRRLPDLLGLAGAGLVTGVVAILLLDGGFTLLGSGTFGRVSGWLAGILPVWLFVEEFRAWRTGAPESRNAVLLAAVLAGLVAAAVGALAAGATGAVSDLPLVTGAVGATAGSAGYAMVWFLGVRRLAGGAGA